MERHSQKLRLKGIVQANIKQQDLIEHLTIPFIVFEFQKVIINPFY